MPNWNFQGGGGGGGGRKKKQPRGGGRVQTKKPSMRGWIFSETTH